MADAFADLRHAALIALDELGVFRLVARIDRALLHLAERGRG